MKNIVTIIFVMIGVSLFAQVNNDKIVLANGNGGLRIKKFNNKKESIKGSIYYYENWNVGTIKFFSGDIIENYPLKYDMKMNQIDIKVDNQVKVTSVGAVKEIIWVNKNGITEILRNALLFNKNQTGFFSVLVDGKKPLLKKTSLKLQEGNYNAALDVGSKEQKYVKTTSYYTIVNNDLKKIKKGKRRVLKVFQDKAEVVKEFSSENNLSFKKDYDLAKIFEYYNSL